eukprot:27472-Eustigmatos_ZCMA.PRE.1
MARGRCIAEGRDGYSVPRYCCPIAADCKLTCRKLPRFHQHIRRPLGSVCTPHGSRHEDWKGA